MSVPLSHSQKVTVMESANALLDLLERGPEEVEADPRPFMSGCKPILDALEGLPREAEAVKYVDDAAIALMMAAKTMTAAIFYDVDLAVTIDKMGKACNFKQWDGNPKLIEQAVRLRKNDEVTRIVAVLFDSSTRLAQAALMHLAL